MSEHRYCWWLDTEKQTSWQQIDVHEDFTLSVSFSSPSVRMHACTRTHTQICNISQVYFYLQIGSWGKWSLMMITNDSSHLPSPGGAITVRLRCLRAIWRGDEQLWLQGLQSDQSESTQSYGQGSRHSSSVIGFTWRRAHTESSTIPCAHTYKWQSLQPCMTDFPDKSLFIDLFMKFPIAIEPSLLCHG
jgi:hypothetical protein